MRTADVIQEWAGVPFEYGLDCCTFAGELIQSVRGYNPMDRFSYANEAEALALIEQHGGLEQAITSVFGDPIPVEEATDGDAVIIDTEKGPVAGVTVAGRIIVRIGSQPRALHLSLARAAWRT